MPTSRLAAAKDIPALKPLMENAIETFVSRFLTPAQLTASRAVRGLDSQLIADGTYFVAEEDGRSSAAAAGAGGPPPMAATTR